MYQSHRSAILPVKVDKKLAVRAVRSPVHASDAITDSFFRVAPIGSLSSLEEETVGKLQRKLHAALLGHILA